MLAWRGTQPGTGLVPLGPSPPHGERPRELGNLAGPLVDCMGDLGDRDCDNAPWRGEARIGDRDPELLSPGSFLLILRGETGESTTSTPESSAALVSRCPFIGAAGMAKICPRPSPKVAVLDPLPPPLGNWNVSHLVTDLDLTLRLITCEAAQGLTQEPPG